MVSKLTKYSCIPGLLTFGTGNVLVQKFLFLMKSVGRDAAGNPEEHYFNKPWFQTESMFFGMFFCVFAYKINCWIKACKAKKQTDLESNLVQTTEGDAASKPVTSDRVWTVCPLLPPLFPRTTSGSAFLPCVISPLPAS